MRFLPKLEKTPAWMMQARNGRKAANIQQFDIWSDAKELKVGVCY